MIDAYYQHLANYPVDVLIAWIAARGVSFFPEELEGVAQRLGQQRVASAMAELR